MPHAPAAHSDRSDAAGAIRTRFRKGRMLIVIVGSVVGLGLLGVGLAASMGAGGPPAKSGAQGDGKPTLDTAEAGVMNFEITTTATGEIAAAKQLEIRSPLERDTTITEVVAEGSVVHSGDVLVRLNDDALRTQLDEESLQLETAKAQVVEADEGYKIQVSENDSTLKAAELKLQIAKLELDQWREGTDKSKKQELDHALERTTKDEQRLAEKLENANKLFASGYYSKDQLKQDELAHEKSVADLQKSQLDKSVYLDFEYPKEKETRESSVDQAAAELERAKRQNNSKLTSKEADLKNKQRSLQIHEDKYKKCKTQVDSAVLKAPTDGLVVYATSMQKGWGWNNEGPLQVGSKVFPNQDLIILPDTSEMVASVRIHESLASIIKAGQAATVKVDALGGERFQGKVASIGILAEQTNRWMDPNLREYTVKIALDLPKGAVEIDQGSSAKSEAAPLASESKVQPVNAAAGEQAPASLGTEQKNDAAAKPALAGKAMPTHRLKPSMRCEAEIMIEHVDEALAVPIQAVFNEGPLRYVHVSDGSRYVRRPVLVGRRSDRYSEIKTGIAAGERVLVRKPAPAEVVARPWDAKELATVGLMTNDQGQIVPLPAGQSGAASLPAPGKPKVAETAEPAKAAAVGS